MIGIRRNNKTLEHSCQMTGILLASKVFRANVVLFFALVVLQLGYKGRSSPLDHLIKNSSTIVHI